MHTTIDTSPFGDISAPSILEALAQAKVLTIHPNEDRFHLEHQAGSPYMAELSRPQLRKLAEELLTLAAADPCARAGEDQAGAPYIAELPRPQLRKLAHELLTLAELTRPQLRELAGELLTLAAADPCARAGEDPGRTAYETMSRQIGHLPTPYDDLPEGIAEVWRRTAAAVLRNHAAVTVHDDEGHPAARADNSPAAEPEP